MENASKTLVMAGTVLISLMVVAALMLSYNNFSNYEQNKSEAKEEKSIVEFNNQYTVYYRDGVRGTDIISLANKVADHNSKADVNEDKIQLAIDLKGKRTDFAYSGTNLLITKNAYNQTDVQTDIIQKAKDIEKNCQGESACFKLVSNIANIVGTNVSKEDALEEINSIVKTEIDDSKLEEYKTDIKKYYEYTQFKRAHFNAKEDIGYSSKGKVNSLAFEFTGKFN